MNKTNKADKIYNIADILDLEIISELTNGLDIQKIPEAKSNISVNQSKSKKYIFRKLSFAAAVAVLVTAFGIAAIAAAIFVPRFFPGIGTIDVEAQMIRELAEPVYLENADIYNVAIDYAAFIRNGDGSGTLLLEYIYVFGSTKPRDEINKIFAGDFEEGEEPGEDDLTEVAEYETEIYRYRDFSYTAEPCGENEANNNLAVPEISRNNSGLKNKYGFEKMQIRSLGDMIENIEESEYYKLIFDNGQTAVIRLIPINHESARSVWTNADAGYKIRITPYSLDNFRYGLEVFPTEDWSDTVNFSVSFLDPTLTIANKDNGRERDILMYPHQSKKDRIQWINGNDLPIISDHVFKDLKGRELNGFNDFTVGFKGAFNDFIDAINDFESNGDTERRVYTKEDFSVKSINVHGIDTTAIFDEATTKRHKVKLPDGDGEIELNQEIDIHGLKYRIDRVKREGDKVEIYYASELLPSSSGNFRVDGYESKTEHKSARESYSVIIIDGVGMNVKSVNIYLTCAHFIQSGNWSVDISG